MLEEAGFKPQLVVGTSAGSLVAALYASGKTSAQLQQAAARHGRSRHHRTGCCRFFNKCLFRLVSPVPVRFASQMGADVVVAVDISSPPEANPAEGTLQILLQTFSIMGKSISQYELKEAGGVVRPSQVGLRSADFPVRQQAIDSGRAAMLAALAALKARLAVGAAGAVAHP